MKRNHPVPPVGVTHLGKTSNLRSPLKNPVCSLSSHKINLATEVIREYPFHRDSNHTGDASLDPPGEPSPRRDIPPL